MPGRRGCLDSEHTSSAVTQCAHACGNYPRSRATLTPPEKRLWVEASASFSRRGILFVEGATLPGAMLTIAYVSVISPPFTEAEHA